MGHALFYHVRHTNTLCFLSVVIREVYMCLQYISLSTGIPCLRMSHNADIAKGIIYAVCSALTLVLTHECPLSVLRPFVLECQTCGTLCFQKN
jgi:hypothetical protein